MTSHIKKTAMAAAIALAASPAVAETVSVSAAYPETVISALQDLGYKASLSTDSYGDPKVTTASNGWNTTIYFYGCIDNEACDSLQFSIALDTDGSISVSSVNSWNLENLIGTAFIDDEDDAVMQHYMGIVDGMSRSVFERNFKEWNAAANEFIDFIGW